MAGNNSIQILRGNNVKTNAAIKNQILLDGQPLYDRVSGLLFVGNGNTIANTGAVNAQWASIASSANSANTRNRLYFNGNGTNVGWNGSSSDTIYVPTSVGSSGQVWGVRSNGTVGWVAQTEIPGTIDHANTANVANTANKLSNSLRFNGAYANGIAYNVAWNGTAPDTIYVPTAIGNSGQVWGMKNSTHAGWIDQEEIPGTVENANYANYAGTAYGVSSCGGTSTVWINGPTSTNGVSINGYSLYLGANRNISVVLNGKTVTTMNDSGININSMNINLGACVQGAKTNIYGFNVDIIGSSMLNLNGGQHVSIKTASVGPAITCSNSASDTSPVRLLTLSANSAQLAIDIGKQRSELTFSSGDNLSGKVSLVAYNTTPPQGSRTFYLPNTGGVLATESTSYSTVLNEFANLGIQVDVGPISGTIQSRTGTAQVAGTDYYTAAASVNIADSDFWDGKPLRMVEITSVTVLAPFTNATANIDGNRISLNYKGPTANTNVTFKYVCKCKASIIRSL